MGADQFENLVWETDSDKAFREARDNATFEVGYGGYSGTIAEKADYRKVRTAPVSLLEARAIINKKSDDNDKFGPAFAIPITKTDGVEESHQITVEVDKGLARSRDYDRLADLAARQLGVRPDTVIISDSRFEYRKELVWDTPSVNLVTRYRVRPASGYVVHNWSVPASVKEVMGRDFDTKAQARKAAIDALDEAEEWSDDFQLNVECVRVPDSDDAIAFVKRTVTGATVTMTVSVVGTPAEVQTDGWMFFGIASS